MNRRARHIVLIILSVFSTICFIYFTENQRVKFELATSRKPIKTILFWTKFFIYPSWTLREEAFEENYLESIGCPAKNCRFTRDKKFLPHPNQYDALVFHGAETESYLKDIPPTRDPRQIYFFASLECPTEIHQDLSQHESFYNFTMTYRLDSDVLWNYGQTIDLVSGKQIAPSLEVQWRQPHQGFFDSELYHIAQQKTKTAAWFVSHCNASSKRDELVEKLQTYIDVDVYGNCGTLQCERNSPICDELLNTTYRFYFAFENTLCDDYVTEKVFKNMENFVVPVIYSGAKLSRFFPPKSYIDVERFDTVEELAKYLQFLSYNPDEYIKYFWWKKYYKVVFDHSLNPCRICQKLNEQDSTTKVYRSIKDWFITDSCRSPRIKL